jgi:hypothetical protein
LSKWPKVAAAEKQKLADRLRAALAGRRGLTEKAMFGGVCFLLKSNMLCGTGSGRFMFRVGKQAHAAAVKRRGAQPMIMRGRTLEGFVWVDPAACDAKSLRSWLALALDYVATLPAKKAR